MDDSISRQAAIDAIVNCTNCGDEKTLREYVAMHDLDNMWSGGVLEALDAVKDLPSAQPTAKWLIHKWGDDAKCSNCGRSFKDVYDMDNYDQYCRHCGTHMKGIEQHE